MTEYSLVECAEDDKDLWNEFAARNIHSGVYHLWEWGDVLCRTYKHRRYYLAVKKEEDIFGVFPCVFVKSLVFGKRLISLPFVEYAGPLVKNDVDLSTAKSVLTRLLAYLDRLRKELKADYTEIRQPPPSLSPMLPSQGYISLQRHMTFRIDLTKGESELWRDLKKKCRNSLRKAMRMGIEIEKVTPPSLKQYYDLYLAAQKRRGSPPHSLDFFRHVYNAFNPAGLLWMSLAMYDDIPIAGVMVFSFREQLYWFGNVTNRKYSSLNPTNLLLWHMIRRGIEENFKIFDLGQTREADRGVYHFKSGWSGEEVNLEDFVSSSKHVDLPNPNQRKYLYLSRVWSMMPNVLARRIGPRVIGGLGL